MEPVAVDCQFNEDGALRVRRIRRQDTWIAISQGRQWQDDQGRHVLIMFDDRNVRELILNAQSLTWKLAPARSSDRAFV